MAHVYDETTHEFVEKPETAVLLTYRADGEPIMLANGKKRERDADLEAMREWCRLMFLRTAPSLTPEPVEAE